MTTVWLAAHNFRQHKPPLFRPQSKPATIELRARDKWVRYWVWPRGPGIKTQSSKSNFLFLKLASNKQTVKIFVLLFHVTFWHYPYSPPPSDINVVLVQRPLLTFPNHSVAWCKRLSKHEKRHDMIAADYGNFFHFFFARGRHWITEILDIFF